MSRAQRRADRIRGPEGVDILQVLSDFGYRVRPEGGDREQQFQCDLHGSGRDNKPSARVYPGTNSWHCWGCGRSRDAIQTVREKEGLDFWAACDRLEKRYGLPPLPWEPEEDVKEPTPAERIKIALDPTVTYEEERTRTERLLRNETSDRDRALADILALWEAYDRIVYGVVDEQWSEDKGKVALASLRDRVLKP